MGVVDNRAQNASVAKMDTIIETVSLSLKPSNIISMAKDKRIIVPPVRITNGVDSIVIQNEG